MFLAATPQATAAYSIIRNVDLLLLLLLLLAEYRFFCCTLLYSRRGIASIRACLWYRPTRVDLDEGPLNGLLLLGRIAL